MSCPVNKARNAAAVQAVALAPVVKPVRVPLAWGASILIGAH
jgi:hypothetical protein